MLPRLFVIPWWLVFLGLGVTALLSVPPTDGEEPNQGRQISQDNQALGGVNTEETMGEEAALIQQLKSRLAGVEERERRLQKKEERVEGLQRDLEQLAARQTLEAQRLSEREAALKAERNRLVEEDPSLTHLTKVYEAMDPEEAALRIEKMKEGLALDLLARLKGKKAAGVLANVRPEKAARLTEGLRIYHQRQIQK